MTDITPPSQIPFTGAQLDHLEDQRDITTLKKHLKAKSTRTILLSDDKVAVGEDGALVTCHPDAVVGQNIQAPGPIFLGLDETGAVFAFSLDGSQTLIEAEAFKEMRHAAPLLDLKSLAMAGRAKSLFEWHTSHRYCAACGQQSQASGGGMYRHCQFCQMDHFPRVNPVVIMLVVDGDDCLLGRSIGWPEDWYSALAGFVSPGESMEEACIREVKEEVGIDVERVEYHFSQPWPFPSQLMMGLTCYAKNREVTVNPREIADAKWYSRQELEAVFKGESEQFRCPPDFTIANQLLRRWLTQ